MKNNRKEQLTAEILFFLYEMKKILTSYSIKQYFLYEYYKIKEEEDKKIRDFKNKKRKVNRAIHDLNQAKLIKIESNKVKITQSGISKAILYGIRNKVVKNIKKDRNTFFIVIFDIPEKDRRLRDLFRKTLYNLEAEKIQRSVFKIDNESAVHFLKDLLKHNKVIDNVKIIKCKKFIN